MDPAAAAANAIQNQALEQARAATYATNAMNVFARATQVREAMSAVQAASRAAALAAPALGVSNGLAPGGLVPLDPASWVNLTAPVASADPGTGRTTVTVRQQQPRGIATWSSFNVGQETDLRFDQSAGGSRAREWAVLNRVEDPTARPSQILGSIQAEGQVYVINRNGIIFGGASQVNVATLIASALDIGSWNDSLARRNLRFESGFLAPPPGEAVPPNYTPQLSHDRPAMLRQRRIAIDIEPGAQITTAEEGSAIFAAPQVRNAGTVIAPSGQVILAAGAGVRLDRPPNGVPYTPLSARIGLEVEALRRGAGADSFGLDTLVTEARNEGIISAPRGNITMAGFLVTNAPGAVLSATTASNRPGSILLTARDFGGAESLTGAPPSPAAQYRFGTVTLAPNSLIEVAAEAGADQVVFNTATAAFEQSRLAITGSAVLMQPGSILRAPAAALRIAGDLPARVFGGGSYLSGGRLQTLVLERDAVIDLGGLKTLTAPVSRNFVEVQTFRGELADAPLQRNGFLYNYAQRRGTVTIDTRIGSEIVNWQATADSVPVNVAERLGAGGSVTIAAERVFALQGSRIDVSGGLLSWEGGMRPGTTRLLGADGRIYDIGRAPADVTFVGIAGEFTATQPRWGITETYRSPLLATRPVFELGYFEGFDAGSVTISGRFYGDGIVEGGVFTSDRQRLAALANDGVARTTSDLPQGGLLSFVGFRPTDATGQPVIRTQGIGGLVNPTIVDAVTSPLPEDFAARLLIDEASTTDRRYRLRPGETLPADRFDTQLSIAGVVGRGWSSITIEGDGRATLPAGVRLELPPGGRLSINAWSADLAGTIIAPAGAITVTANAGDRVPQAPETLASRGLFPLPITLPASARDGAIQVGPLAVLSTRGLWINDFVAAATGGVSLGSAYIDGGSITLQTRFSPYPTGREPRVPQGARVDAEALPVFGRDLTIAAGATLDVSGGGHVAPDRTLTAGRGGSLTLGTYSALATSPTGAPLALGARTRTDVGFVVLGRFATPIIEAGATLTGFGTARVVGGSDNALGGTLSLAAPAIALGRAPTAADVEAGVFVLPDLDRFAAQGFAEFQLTAVNAGGLPYRNLPAGTISVAPGAVIAPVASSRVVPPTYLTVATGSPPEFWGGRVVGLPAADRGPTRLTLTATGTLDLGGRDTVLRADPGGPRTDSHALISLSAARPTLIEGTLDAPAGEITITGTAESFYITTIAGEINEREIAGTEFGFGDALWLASTARLSARGLADFVVQSDGLVAGSVRPGGRVTVREGRGWLVFEQGATIDVSGATGFTDMQGGIGFAPEERPIARLPLAGDAGSITLGGGRGAFLDGAMLGHSGGPQARGALLTVNAPNPQTLSFAYPNPGPPFSLPLGLFFQGPRGIVVRQSGPTLPDAVGFGDNLDTTLVRTGATTWRGGERTERAFLPADALAGSGIDRLYLQALPATVAVMFEGQVALSVPRAVQIETQQIVVVNPLSATAPRPIDPPSATISTGYLVLNSNNVFAPAPTAALIDNSAIRFEANWIDIIGGVNLYGARSATLASSGDLRLIGVQPDTNDLEFGRVLGRLAVQGDLTLRAGQIYPATGTNFTIRTIRSTGTRADFLHVLRFEGTGGAPPEAPLSAGAILNVEAGRTVQSGSVTTVELGRLEQAGVLRVPQGRLTLTATTSVDLLAGSLTSVSGDGRLVPHGELVSDQGPLGISIYPSQFGPGGASSDGLAAPAEKTIVLTAPQIRFREGASLDASGGAEQLAFSFIAGPGGSRDVLARAVYTSTDRAPPVASRFQYDDRRDVFAILPGTQPAAAPVSPYIIDSGSSLGRGDVTALPPSTINAYGQQTSGEMPMIGDQIRIGPGVAGLPAGTYTLLPARYAVLPGAYQVVIPPATSGPRVETPFSGALQRPDGSWIASATRVVAGTAIAEDRSRLIRISPASTWSLYSGVTTRTGSEFFTSLAERLDTVVPRLPVDAGRLQVTVTRSTRADTPSALLLDGAARFDRPAGARGGQVEITAERIAVTPGGAPYATADFLPVSDVALSSLRADTLTLGGTRSQEAEGERLNISARAVTVAQGASLTVPEVLIVARSPTTGGRADDGIRLENGAQVVSSGAVVGASTSLLIGRDPLREGDPGISGDGAVLRASGGAQAQVTRENLPTGLTTGLAIGAGATLAAPSVLIDITGAASLNDRARFQAGVLDLVGNVIVLGDAGPAGSANALALSPLVLEGLSGIGAVTLRSRSNLDVYGAVALRAGEVTLDAATLRGFAGTTGGQAAALAVDAARVATLRNSLGMPGAAAAGGAGSIGISAGEEIRIGGGALTVSGFGPASLSTPGALTLAGPGQLSLPGNLAITTARIAGQSGAEMTVTAAGTITVANPGTNTVPLPDPALGARLALEAGAGLVLATPIVLPSGAAALTARTGDVVLDAGALIDVAGRAQAFFDVLRITGAGNISLAASRGNVVIAPGVALDLGAALPGVAGGGESGSLIIRAQAGTANLAGALLRAQGGAGTAGGGFTLDTRTGVDLGALNATLDAAGFFGRRVVHTREGSLLVPGGSMMRAREIGLTADGGGVFVGGVLDASGPKGGEVSLFGRDAVAFTPGAAILATASEAGRPGGTVEIGAGHPTGVLSLGGVRIDVTGQDALRGSLVRLRLPVGMVASPATEFAATVGGARRVEVEPYGIAAAPAATATAATWQTAIQTAFNAVVAHPGMAALPGKLAALSATSVAVTPGVEVRSPPGAGISFRRPGVADLPINLRGLRFNGEPGVLTLRAEGDLVLEGTITDGFRAITEDEFRAMRQILPSATLTTTQRDELTAWQTNPRLWLLDPVRRPVSEAEFRAANGLPTTGPLSTAQQASLLLQRADRMQWVAGSLSQRPYSWSIRLVAGADLASANPLATRDSNLLGAGVGSVLLGASWGFTGSNSPATRPMAIRTGTGSIDIAAALDVRMRDPDVAVFTAGRAIPDHNRIDGTVFYEPIAPTYSVYNPRTPSIDDFDFGIPETVLDYPATYSEEGGNLRVTAGRDIAAVVLDPRGNNAGSVPSSWLSAQGSVDAVTGDFIYRPQVSNAWTTFVSGTAQLPVPARSTQTSWWVNYSRFSQNFGVLGGGDADFRAARDFQGSISIPTSGRTGGGLAPTYDFAYRTTGFATVVVTGATPLPAGFGAQPDAVLRVDGGGDLAVAVGRNIGVASQFLVGRGEGSIRAGGSVAGGQVGTVSTQFPTGTSPDRISATVGSLFAVGDARLQVVAGGGVTASVYDPLQVPAGRLQQFSDAWGVGGTTALGAFSSYSPTTSVSLNALGGDVTLLGTTGNAELGIPGSVSSPLTALRLAPRGFSFGQLLYREYQPIQAADTFSLNYRSDDSNVGVQQLPPNLAIRAYSGDVRFQPVDPAEGTTITLSLEPRARGQLELFAQGSIVRPTIALPDGDPALRPSAFRPTNDTRLFTSTGRISPDNRRFARSQDTAPPLRALLREADPERSLIYAVTGDIERPVITATKRIGVRAGGDITDLTAVVQHAHAGDISFIWAGRDIGTLPDPLLALNSVPFGNTVEIRGPGRMQLIAGRDIARIRRASNIANPLLGDVPADNGLRSIGNTANLLLPEGGAGFDLLFGIGPADGFDATGFLDRILDPSNAAQQRTTYRVELATFGNGSVTWALQSDAPQPTAAETLARVRGLPLAERLALSIDLYFRELDASGKEAAAATSGLASYQRGFDAINALFPYGNYSGNLNLQSTYIRTEQGGDVNVLGPGGAFFLGAISNTVDRFPDRIGVLTLNYGSINLFADGDIQAGQSRVITVDGGDIFMWSSTADINAGLGSRTARFVPPFQVTYLPDGTRVPNRAGLITGSGIATYTPFTAPEEVAALQRAPLTEAEAAAQAEERRRRTAPSINLVAPVGAVDFGDAGVRSAGNLNVAAQTVLNAQNVQVAGTSTGVPTVQSVNVAAAVAAAAAAGSTAGTAADAARQATRADTRPQEPPSTIVVEIIGYGGSAAEAAAAR